MTSNVAALAAPAFSANRPAARPPKKPGPTRRGPRRRVRLRRECVDQRDQQRPGCALSGWGQLILSAAGRCGRGPTATRATLSRRRALSHPRARSATRRAPRAARARPRPVLGATRGRSSAESFAPAHPSRLWPIRALYCLARAALPGDYEALLRERPHWRARARRCSSKTRVEPRQRRRPALCGLAINFLIPREFGAAPSASTTKSGRPTSRSRKRRSAGSIARPCERSPSTARTQRSARARSSCPVASMR